MLHRYTFPFTSVVLALIGSPTYAGDDPAVGTTQILQVVSVSVSADGVEKDSRRVVYAPPPGWYIRSHRVVAENRQGRVSFAVNTLPAGLRLVSDERTASAARASGSLNVSAPPRVSAGAQVSGSQEMAAAGVQSSESSHNLLVVDVSARGPGLWCGHSGVDLTVYAEIVYLAK